MNILMIQTFLNIVRFQSFSGAAEAMYTSQPTVSMRLNQLEEELGVQLIKRKKGHRTVELTANGQAFVPLAEHWLELDRRTQQFCQQSTSEPVRVTAPASLQEHMLPHVVRKLKERDIDRIQLHTDSSKDVYSVISNRDADIGLALRPLQKDGVIAIPVFEAETMILCPANTPLPDEPIFPDQLDPSFEVSVTSWTGEIRRWHELYWDSSVIPYIQVDNNHMTHNYLDKPECWAMCPAEITTSVLERSRGELTVRHLAVAAPKHMCYMVIHRSFHSSKPELIENFREAIRDYVNETDWMESL